MQPFFCFLNSRVSFGDMENIKINITVQLQIIPKKLQRCFDQWKTQWNKHADFVEDNFKKINVAFIVHFCLDK